MATSPPPWKNGWPFDAVNNRYVNNMTGETITMPTILTGGIGTSVTTSNTITNAAEHWEKTLIERLIKQGDEIEQYRALRLYLSAAHPDVLTEFDAMFNARKRMEIK